MTKVGFDAIGTSTTLESNKSHIWFNSVVKVSGQGANPVTIRFPDSTIDFTANNTSYHLPVPSSEITFMPTATAATTAFDAGRNAWVTIVPSSYTGNVFLAGLVFQVPNGGLPGGINPVTWSGEFATDTPGMSIQWQWAAAVYTRFSTDNNALGAKPVDGSKLTQYTNADHAGTPETFKAFVIGGARGGGGSNFTGSIVGRRGVLRSPSGKVARSTVKRYAVLSGPLSTGQAPMKPRLSLWLVGAAHHLQ